MLKKMLMKKMMKKQMADVPVEQQEKMMGMIEKNPDLFEKIGKEIKAEMKNGKDQMAATMEVTQKYNAELAEAMRK